MCLYELVKNLTMKPPKLVVACCVPAWTTLFVTVRRSMIWVVFLGWIASCARSAMRYAVSGLSIGFMLYSCFTRP